jgi:lysophospholipase L1-like esterase
MRRSLCSVLVFALALVASDLAVATFVCRSDLAWRPVEMQHPSTLLAKLDRLRNAPHPRVVLVGDSLIYGGILEEFGDADWRSHGLGEQLADAIEQRVGRRPFVLNLGMNGALPADLEALVPLVAACDVDWIVLDIHLRPFSTDFSAPARQMSRSWLRQVTVGSDGQARWRPDGTTGWLAGRLSEFSSVARARGLIQENLLSAGVVHRPAVRPGTPQADTDADFQALVKLAQLKNRLKALDLDPDAPQVAALRRTLAGLAARGQRHVVFYAKENPDLLPDVMDGDEHAAWSRRLTELVTQSQGPAGVFVPPVAELRSEHFLDLTHLNAEGYRLLARRVAAEIK